MQENLPLATSLAYFGIQKTAIIFFLWWLFIYSILSYLIFLSENYFLFPVALSAFRWSFTHRSCCSSKSTIHVSLHILIISLNMWYFVQYVYSFYYFIRFLFSPSSYLSESPLPASYLLSQRLILRELLTVIPLTYWFDDSTVSIGLSLLFINFQSTISHRHMKYDSSFINIFLFFSHIWYKWYLPPIFLIITISPWYQF